MERQPRWTARHVPRIRIISTALTALMVHLHGATAQEFCHCGTQNDIGDLNALKEKLYTGAELSRELSLVLANPDSVEGLSLDAPFSPITYQKVMDRVLTTVGLQRYPWNFPNKQPGGRTDWSPPIDAGSEPTCKMNLPEDVSACILQAIAVHEDVHVLACQKFNGDLSRQSMRQAIEEEIEAYNAGWKFSQVRRRKLECTCDYYAIRLRASLEFLLPTSAAGHASGTVDVALRFQDDGSFVAQGPMSATGTTDSPGCTGELSWSFDALITGTIDGPEGSTQMHMDISTDSAVGQAALTCFGSTFNIPIAGSGRDGGKSHLDIPAVAGSQGQSVSNFNGVSSTLTATIVEMPAKARLTQDVLDYIAGLPGGEGGWSPGPDALPNCKANP